MSTVKFNADLICDVVDLIEKVYIDGHFVVLHCGDKSIHIVNPIELVERLKELEDALT